MTDHLDPTPVPRFMASADDRWRDDAACLTADPEMFFPEPADHVSAAAAVAVCNTCPVTDACLRDALETGEQHGIRGGLTPRHRAQLRTDRRRGLHRTARDYAPTRRRAGDSSGALWQRIASEIDRSGGTRLSQHELADRLGVSRGRVQRAIAEHGDAFTRLTSARPGVAP